MIQDGCGSSREVGVEVKICTGEWKTGDGVSIAGVFGG
jgi:hypothetical protein